ncbi:MAG: HEAT repeat domain-containing protein [Planctomycetaceae bacterium]|nr:HEAT repeat domain-containing protein [Planctomycetaceae bacterium]
MGTAFFDKTVKFLTQNENPASNDLLRILLDNEDWKVRSQAFDALFLKRDAAISLELFSRFLVDESEWLLTTAVNPDRLARLADAAIRSNDQELIQQAIDLILRHRLYDGLKSILPLMDSPKEDLAVLAAKAVYDLAEKFYEELAACTNATEVRNFDRRREWISTELEDTVRRFSIHGMIEPIKALLIVTKKDYSSFLGILADQHSSAVKTILDLLENGEHGGYLRLLLSFVDDAGSPPLIDQILCRRKDVRFVRYLLTVIGGGQLPATTKQALKRFKDFEWLQTDNPELPAILEGLEGGFVQLISNIALPRERVIELFRYIFASCSPEGRRVAAEAFRSFTGDDFNALIMEVVNDPDPVVCSSILKLIKSRGFKEADQVIARCVDQRSEPELFQTVYDLMPDFHLDSYLQKVVQLTETQAKLLGRIVRKVDTGTDKTLASEITSILPVRRIAAVRALQFMGLGKEYQDQLIHVIQTDDDMNVRIAGCEALATVLTVEALRALKDATQDRAFALRSAAAEAVEKWTALYNQSKKCGG